MRLTEETEIRPAREADVETIHALILELATYEKLSDKVVGTPQQLRQSLFERHDAEVFLIEAGGEPIGYAIIYVTFSSFECRSGIWLEDVYVKPEHRRGGIGRAIMEYLAGLALERGHVRFEWCALDWNEPAMNFYDEIGATRMNGWTMLRLEVDGMRHLAGS